MSKPREPVKRRDATGHLDPQYERDLLEKARASRNSDKDAEAQQAFIAGPASAEELSEELGEAYLQSATSGEQSEPARHERITPDESGGPFVPTSARREFAEGTDESNIAEATREPLPRTSKADP
jgi:hypothetical protein